MSSPQQTPAGHVGNRQSALYGTLVTFLVINNFAVAARLFAHYRIYYRTGRRIFLEDIFVFWSGVCVNIVIGNLLASTHYGLGLHSSVINAEDPHMPRNLTVVFMHVWVCMILTGPTFTFIKLSLLFFYRRLFLVNQKWLRVAWWANLIYVVLWFFGATGFYIFQCWPVQWYWMRYYPRYHVEAPGALQGQCNATSVGNVAMPLIFGLVSDVALLLLPITAILKLQISTKKKIGLAGIFSVGVMYVGNSPGENLLLQNVSTILMLPVNVYSACLLELARIIELEVDTDDALDPSYGVVIFLILSVAEEVCAIACGSLPVVIPQLFQEYKKFVSAQKSAGNTSSTKVGSMPQSRSMNSRGFQKLGGDGLVDQTHASHDPPDEQTDWPYESYPLDAMEPPIAPQAEDRGDARIVVKREIQVTFGDSNPGAVENINRDHFAP